MVFFNFLVCGLKSKIELCIQLTWTDEIESKRMVKLASVLEEIGFKFSVLTASNKKKPTNSHFQSGIEQLVNLGLVKEMYKKFVLY